MTVMRSGPSLQTYPELSIQSGIPPCIQGQLHTWLTDLLYSHRQRVTLNRFLSFPLPVKAGVPIASVLGPVLILIFINNRSDSP